MKKNKVVLPLIIVLLVIFLPCSIYGIYHQVVFQKEQGNPNHLHKLDNKLYYYDNNDNLLGVYECKSSPCDDAVPQIDDEYLKHYEGSGTPLGVFGAEYTFIADGSMIKLHNIKTNLSIAEFTLIKNYGASFAGGNIIVRDTTGLYGLFNLNTISYDIVAKYTFMGLANNIDSGLLVSDRIAVEENGKWFIISDDDIKLSVPSDYPIYDYDYNYIYHVNNGYYYIYKYDGTTVLYGETIRKIDTVDKYHVLQNGNGQVLIYDYDYVNIIKTYSDFSGTLDYKIEDNKINIYSNNNLYDSFDIENGV